MNRPAHIVRPTLLIFAAALALGACQSIVPGANRPPPRLYELTPKSTFDKSLPRIGAQIIVETPSASSTSRIAVKERAVTLDYYAQSEWTDVAPNLVQTLLVESFENSKRALAVARDGSGLRADYILKPDLREFQAELYRGPQPSINVRINVKLVRMPSREIIASQTFQARITAKSGNLDDVIQAFDESLGKVLKRIVEWTIKEVRTEGRKGNIRRRQ